jgi:hypothetical protein
MISEPMVRSTQTMQQSRIKISIISKQTKTSIHLSLVTKKYHRVHPTMISDLRLAQTMHLSCANSNSLSKWIETRFHKTDVIEEIHQVRPK